MLHKRQVGLSTLCGSPAAILELDRALDDHPNMLCNPPKDKWVQGEDPDPVPKCTPHRGRHAG
eukprot:1444346-Alexandrium_andersonii.AAC.1